MSTAATQDVSVAQVEIEMEPLEVRWMHTGAKHLSLPTAPITAAETAYKAFSMDESDRIEAEWEKLSERQQAKVVRQWGRGDGEWSPKERSVGTKGKGEDNEQDEKAVKELQEADEAADPATPAASEASLPDSPEDKAEVYKSIIERARTDPSKLDEVHGVPVAQVSVAPTMLTAGLAVRGRPRHAVAAPRLLASERPARARPPRHMVRRERDAALLVGPRRRAGEGVPEGSALAADVQGRTVRRACPVLQGRREAQVRAAEAIR
jgi:hypothetical protein